MFRLNKIKKIKTNIEEYNILKFTFKNPRPNLKNNETLVNKCFVKIK